jgi:hypothetical protein
MRLRFTSTALAVAALGLASGAQAQVDPALNSFSGGTFFFAFSGGGQDTVGWDFTVTQPVVVNALGYYDEGADGLASSHPVGLWDAATQTLLASNTVDTTDLAGPTFAVTATVNGRFLFDTFDGGGSLTLVPGTRYVLGGYVPAGSSAAVTDGYRSAVTSPSFDPGIVFGQNRRDTAGTAPGLTFPDVAAAGNGRFGPNIGFIIPEPASAAIAGAGMLAFMARRRRAR